MGTVGCGGGRVTVPRAGGTDVMVIVGGAVRPGSTSDGDTSSGESPEEQAAAIKATSIAAQTALANKRREVRLGVRLAGQPETRDRRVAF